MQYSLPSRYQDPHFNLRPHASVITISKMPVFRQDFSTVNPPKWSSHKALQARVLSRISPSYIPQITSYPVPRAVYIFLRPCIQSFNNRITRYLNLPLRLVHNRTGFSHWGLLISNEIPSTRVQPGEICVLKDWEKTSFRVELDAPHGDDTKKRANVGSFENKYPTVQPIQKKFIYLGTTMLSNEEIKEKGETVLKSLNREGGYHGLYRNCQHFTEILSSLILDSEENGKRRLPRRADRWCCGLLWVGLWWKFRDMRKRIRRAREFYIQQTVQEKEGLERCEGKDTMDTRTLVVDEKLPMKGHFHEDF